MLDDTLAVSLRDIEEAAKRIQPYIHRTPLLTNATLTRMVGADIRFKGEHLQKSGSFKIRGALNRLLLLNSREKQRGVVAFSSGNHAQGVALAARITGIKATIVMPSDVSPVKLAATRGYGADVVLFDKHKQNREVLAREIAASTGATLVPPFDDPRIIAGQGTVGLEVALEWPQVEVALIPVGGGGLISGMALALKSMVRAQGREIEVIGVEPEVADDARQSMEAGSIVTIPQPDTVADGVATPSIGDHPFRIMTQFVDRIVSVPETCILETMELLMTRTKQVIEPTGALATAAIFSGAVNIQGRKTMSLLCGGNLDFGMFRRLANDRT